ncbi:MAG TPA: sodium:solute symporter family protein [Capillimicrobium sp.]|nr:sodium:solute symporter family protein [Capillimicrobium sp.]
MDRDLEVLQLVIVIALFLLVSAMGFLAARWRRAQTLDNLHEWGLGGRSFGSWITWFLLGGDLYTAYTFVAVPALVFGVGAVGFFAVPYTIVVYPIVMLAAVRLWSVAHAHGYVTPADFVAHRFGAPWLALAIAVTGIVATMPYIALQLVGIEAVLKAMGITGEWPLIIAFAVLAAYTYQSGLRAPALIAFVKDTLIYVVVLVAVIAIPIQLGGFDDIFGAAEQKFASSPAPTDSVLLGDPAMLGYATLAFGSALALFIYPHTVTGLLAARSRDTIKRNMAALPAYTLLLGLLALLGYMAIAAGVTPVGDDANTIVPLLFDAQFPDWFAGIAFAAVAIGALVPAAIMSIAAANLFTRNIYATYVNRAATPEQEARVSRIASLVVKAGAVAVILALDPQFSIDLQLIGGVIILQTLPSLVLGLWRLALHRWALLAGWAVGLATGLWMLYDTPNATTGKEHFGGSQYALSKLGIDTDWTVYTGILALLANLIVVVVGSLVLRAAGAPRDRDATRPEDYEIDARDPRLQRPPATAEQGAAAQ